MNVIMDSHLMYKVIFFLSLILVIYCKGTNESVCDDEKCVSKCCPRKAYVVEGKCVSNNNSNKDFSDFEVYDSELVKIGTAKDIFHIVDGKFQEEVIPPVPIIKTYLLENGLLKINILLPNAFPTLKIFNNENFCIDYLFLDENTTLPVFIVSLEESTFDNKNFRITALIISSIFLLSVLIIYALLKELRNFKGKIVMAYVLSLLGAFISLVVLQIITSREGFVPEVNDCYLLTLPVYFFFLATCCWMNVMSFDIWWTLRTISYRRKLFSNIIINCIYAWGLPLIMTVALYTIDKADLSDKPWIVKPNIVTGGCFLNGNEKLVYLYAPMLILILLNWIFYLLTAFNYWMFGRETMILETRMSIINRKQKERFLVYVKLSLIMGISWILEIISVIKPKFPLFYLTDAYNMFIGLAIFLIFVCKKKIFIKLRKRFTKNDQQEYSLNTKST